MRLCLPPLSAERIPGRRAGCYRSVFPVPHLCTANRRQERGPRPVVPWRGRSSVVRSSKGCCAARRHTRACLLARGFATQCDKIHERRRRRIRWQQTSSLEERRWRAACGATGASLGPPHPPVARALISWNGPRRRRSRGQCRGNSLSGAHARNGDASRSRALKRGPSRAVPHSKAKGATLTRGQGNLR